MSTDEEKVVKMWTLVLVLWTTLAMAKAMPADPTTVMTTSRSTTPHFGDTIKQLTSQLMELNATSPDILTMDTRTPPKVKQQMVLNAKKPQPQIAGAKIETSHAGVAIPVDEEEIMMAEETTKKLNFYKIERPNSSTTNSGLSTWILLSGSSTTTKPVVSSFPVGKDKVKTTTTTERSQQQVVEPNKVQIKPIFKKRVPSSTTTRKPSPSTTTTSTTTPRSTTTATTKLTKIKASILHNAKKAQTTPPQSTTPKVTKKTVATTTKSPTTTTTSTPNNTTTEALPVEAKDGETDLSESTSASTKKKRPSSTTGGNKRKKNKNRRRKPSDKSDDSTKLETKTKEKPLGTQLYSYLSREVMPTVGVGLVGLMVTAGLASYFLYPFGIARRNYEVIDRKDNEGSYYYNNDNYSGMAEEEAIGKVIAGMPSNALYGDVSTGGSGGSAVNSYKAPTRYTSTKIKNRQVDYSSYDYQPITSYNNEDRESSREDNASNHKRFVVGNVPTSTTVEEATPAVVPEHGPRSLRLRRKKRQVPPTVDDQLNEISSDLDNPTTTAKSEEEELTTFISSTTTIQSNSSGTTQVTPAKQNLFDIFKDLLRLKINLGLQLIQNATQALSRYVSGVQTRLDHHYKTYKNRTSN